MTHVWPESVSIPLVTTQVIVQLRSGIGGNEYIQPLVQPRASCSGFLDETPRAAPEESKTGRGIVLVFPHETPRTGLTALTGRGISNYGATARVSQ